MWELFPVPVLLSERLADSACSTAKDRIIVYILLCNEHELPILFPSVGWYVQFSSRKLSQGQEIILSDWVMIPGKRRRCFVCKSTLSMKSALWPMLPQVKTIQMDK